MHVTQNLPVRTVEIGAPELSVVVPTFKERGNVGELVRRIDLALPGVSWEVIFVDDDSPDGTVAAVRELGRNDRRVRCIRRVGRRGLSGATIEGMLASSADNVAVMDADLQHDEKALAAMLAMLRRGDCDLAVGTRYGEGGDVGAFASARLKASRLSTRIAQRVLGVTLSDPMSGFFMLRREALDAIAPDLSTQGFKILLDLVVTGKGRLRIAEVPYTFGQRFSGESKLDTKIAIDFIGLIASKATGDRVSPRFVSFMLVGGVGLVVNLLTLKFAFSVLHYSFDVSVVAATIVAMTGNFFLNNWLTYHDQRLKGTALLRGLFGFYAICSFGALVNVGVAGVIFRAIEGAPFSLLISGFLGAVGSAIWNFAMANMLVWRLK
jgi:dolichol-phosphate mannosyltransferase